MTSFLFSSAITNPLLTAPEDRTQISGPGSGPVPGPGPGPGPGPAKRLPSFEDGDDSERSQLKKRRKQSKPVRITLDDDDPTAARENGNESANQTQDQDENQSEEGSSEVSDGSASPDPEPPDSPPQSKTEIARSAPLDLSKLSSGDSDVSVDVMSFLEKTETEPGVNESPYHQFQGPYPKPPPEPFNPLAPTLPTSFKQFRSPALKSPIGLGPMRIFNPEAFCNLCNKEFCNKYFLKTHKANKHGIYSESLSGNPLESLNTDYQPSPVDVSSPNPAVKFWFSRKPFFVGSGGSFPKYSTSQAPSSGAKAYCNICQRQFCNKYFVRRHKAKIHGIVESTESTYTEDYSFLDLKLQYEESQAQEAGVDPDSDDYSRNPNFSEISPSQSAPPVTSETAATPNTPLASSQPNVQVGSKAFDCNANPGSNSNSTSSHSRPVCEVCEKEFCSRHSLRRHKAKVHGIRSSVISTSLGQDVLLERLQNDDSSRSFSDSESYHKSEAQEDSQDCRKDFSRVSEETDVNPADRDSSTPNRSIKIEPGLVPSSSGPSNFAFPNESISPRPSEDQDRNEICRCEMCGKPFQSQFLLSMHRTYFHNFPEANHFRQEARSPNSPDGSRRSKYDGVKREHNEEDIQKLHSLIMKLNNLNVENVTVCDVCSEDLGHISALENHILREHGELLDEVSRMIDEEAPHHASESKFACRICQHQFPSAAQLDQHVCVQTPGPSLKIPQPTSGPSQPEPAQKSEPHHSQAPSTSFCDICKKELCNKYFMKTHMQRMHNISIETGANVGGVVCDICNKTLCSKYFLRVHKQNSHGIVDDVLLPPRLWTADARNQSPTQVDASLKPTEKTDFSYKYFSHFLEVCPLCFRRFRSTKWLRAHLLNEHGEEGKLKWLHFQNQLSVNSLPSRPNWILRPTERRTVQMQPSTAALNENMLAEIINGKNSTVKQCSYCPFSTRVLALLFMHERTHIMGGNSGAEEGFQCPLCRDKLPTGMELERHVARHYNISLPDRRKGFDDSPTKKEENGDPTGSVLDADSKTVLEHLRRNPALDLNIIRRGHSKDLSRSGSNGADERPDTARSPIGGGFTLGSDFRGRQEADITDTVSKMKEALHAASVKTNLPTTFAIPQNQDSYIMQPFYLENVASDQSTEPSGSFLSSLVYLPVKQKLSKAVTVSFKLTPT
ncbi:LOW QUALITY PROTEIN: uncharacterized protein [Bemisia tabaci]